MDEAEPHDPEPRDHAPRGPADPAHPPAPTPQAPASQAPASQAPASQAPAGPAGPGEPPLPPLPSVLKLLTRSLLQTSGHALVTRAPTPGGQIAGTLMLLAPAVTHPLPLDGAPHAVVQLVATVVGSLGAVIVFSGLVICAVLRQPPSQPRPRDEALLALPHPRVIWIGLVVVLLLLAGGALWSLARGFGGNPTDRLADALLLGLPAIALGWAAWHSRVMRTAPTADQQRARSTPST